MIDAKFADNCRSKLWPLAVMLLVVFSSGPAVAGTSVKASAGDVRSFLGGNSGKLVYSDENDGGKCYWIDLNDMSVHKLSDDGDCKEPLISPDGSRVVYGLYQTPDKYNCSGVNTANAYIRQLSGGSRSQVGGAAISGKQAFAPHWWIDPGNGSEHIVFMDAYCKDKQTASGLATWTQKIVSNQASGNPVRILKHAFDGGLSKDGKRVGEAYYYLYLAQTMDLGGGDGSSIGSRLDGGKQCCNASMSPDNQYRIMHLRIDHEGCDIRDGSDKKIRTISKPSGATEMQNPEFSTHPGYSTFTAQFGSNYYIYLANTATGANLKIAEGDFGNPHLWVGSSQPSLQLNPSSLSFAAEQGAANPAAQTVSVTNPGGGTLDDVSVSDDAAWLSVGQSGSGNSQSLENTVSIAGLNPGNYDATVSVTCANVGNSPQTYAVSLTVTEDLPLHLRINCGDNQQDVAGWERDDAYETLGADWINTNPVATDGVLDAAPAGVYQSVRHRNALAYPSFRFGQVKDGDYTVRLHFADAYDSRQINVDMEGRRVLTGYDIAADAGGVNRAAIQNFAVTVQDGNGLTIDLGSEDDGDAFVAGIEIMAGADSQAPVVSILNPVAAQTVSASINVSGSADDDSDLLRVEVQVNDGPWQLASGLSSWSLPLDTTTLANGPVTLTARAVDTSNNTALDSIDINVDNSVVAPLITLISPNGGEVWQSGSEQMIRWTTEGLSDVSLSYSVDGGSNWQNIANSVDVDSIHWENYQWTVPDQSSTQCLIMIKGYFGEAPTQSAAPFEIRTGADLEPSITIITPNGGEIWVAGSTEVIRWSTINLKDVSISYSLDNGQTWTTIVTSIDFQADDWAAYPWTVPDQASTQCLILMKGYFGEAPTQSAQVFEIRLPDTGDGGVDGEVDAGDQTDPDIGGSDEMEIVFQGGCNSTGANSFNLLFLVFLLIGMTWGSRRMAKRRSR